MNDSFPSQQPSKTLPIPRLRNTTLISKQNNTKTKSDRNSKSCDNCRKRKVRCNANIQMPCSGCEKDGVECRFVSTRKKMGPPSKEYTASLEQRVQILEQLLEEERRKNNKNNDISSTSEVSVQCRTISYDHSDDIILSDMIQQPQQDPLTSTTVFLQPSLSTISSSSPSSTSIIELSQDLIHDRCSHVLNLIQEIPGLTLELAECMIGGCFMVSLYSVTMVINKYEFLTQFYYQYPQPLDKYLFYSVCAVGCHFLPPELKNQNEISTIGRLLRKKAMGAMGHSYRRSNITTVQTLILLATLAPGSESCDGSSTNWLILGAAVRMAQDMDLLYDSNVQYLSKREIQLRRRIAYTLYALDKFFSAACGKPFTIRDDNINVEAPLEYELQPEEGFIINSITNGPLPKLLEEAEKDISETRVIHNELMEMYSLAQTLCRILVLFYGPKSVSSIEFRNELDNLLIEFQTKMETICADKNRAMHRVLYAGVLLLRYQPITAKITSGRNDCEIQLLDLCTMAANNIVEILDTLQLPEIPSITDGLISLATSMILRNCNHTDIKTRSQARKNLKRCVDIYMRDEMGDRSQNAVVLSELVNQMREMDSILM
ncbi:fungal-specific transcription factor domain-containing protein [Phascolomyces articulosus]|uniref:Fungal-specific transcription factor domain-containing protein n=1 Tax=Phascolomyces articulosus TaxID=60185 RepID=A0AAD5JYI3_9FUNG|nr:fungal-specific transcription factor domain-containing protein [Phascolomyces articulosus]